MFDPATVDAGRSRLSATSPATAAACTPAPPASSKVFVNGRPIDDGEATGELPGTVLRSGRDTETVEVPGTARDPRVQGPRPERVVLFSLTRWTSPSTSRSWPGSPGSRPRCSTVPSLPRAANLPNLGDSALLDSTVDGRSVTIRIQRRFTGQLASVVTRVVDPAKLTWVEVVVYDLDAHRGQHTIVPDHDADRLKSSYTTTLVTDPAGDVTATRRTAQELGVRSPIARHRVEQAIISGLDEYAQAEAGLLARWVGESSPA